MMESILVSYVFSKVCDTLISQGKKAIESGLEQEQEQAFIEIIEKLCEIDKIFENKEFFVGLLNTGKNFDSIYEVLREVYPLKDEEELNEKKEQIEKIINTVVIKYPKLKDYLLIDTITKLSKKEDSKQILSYKSFLEESKKNPIATPISNSFLCDNIEEYIEQCIDNKIILFTGEAGVGKTKTAVEIGKIYSERENRNFKIISFKGINFDKELIEKFKDENYKHLIMIDDANRSYEIFEKILKIYAKRIESGNIKIFLTVRSYAKGIFKKYLDNFNGLIIDLSEENKKYIEKTLEEDYGIKNKDYIEKILFISKKNYRLTLMIAKIYIEDKKNSELDSIIKIYEKYFSKIEDELDLLRDEECLKLLLALSSYGKVDIRNENMRNLLKEIFDINLGSLEKTKNKLYEKEIINVHMDKILEISDQVLSTYLFYDLFFRKKIMSVETFISNILLINMERAKDILYPILNTFQDEETIDYLKSESKKYLKKFELTGSKKYDLYKFFSFIYFDKIFDEICIFLTNDKNAEKNILDEYILDFLQLIKRYKNEKEIIKLYFLYLKKEPLKKEKIKKSILENYLYKKESPEFEYILERNTVESLIEIVKKDTEAKEIIFPLLEKFLEIEVSFSGQSLLDKRSISFGYFTILENKNIRELRNLIFDFFEEYYLNIYFSNEIFEILKNYTSFMRKGKKEGKAIIQNDLFKIENIFKVFYCKNFKERFLIGEYYKFLDIMEVHSNKEILEKLYDEETEFYIQSKEFHFSKQDYSFKFFKEFNSFELDLKIILQILKYIGNEGRNFKNYINYLEEEIYLKKEDEKYLKLINEIFSNNDLGIILNVRYMIDRFEETRVYNLIRNNEFKFKMMHLNDYYIFLDVDQLEKIEEEVFLEIYKIGEFEEIDYSIALYKKIKHKYPKFMINAIKFLLERGDAKYINNLSIFTTYKHSPEEIIKAFEYDFELLKYLYKILYRSDYSLLNLYSILEKDIKFLNEYIREIYIKNYYNINFNRLYNKPLYPIIFKKILGIMLEDNISLIGNMTKTFFNDFERDRLIVCDLILENIKNEIKISQIFEMLSGLELKYKKYYYLFIIENKIDIDIFRRVDLFSRMSSGSGSLIPMIDEKITIYKEIVSDLSTIEKRRYRVVVKEKIDILEETKQIYLEKEIYEEY